VLSWVQFDHVGIQQIRIILDFDSQSLLVAECRKKAAIRQPFRLKRSIKEARPAKGVFSEGFNVRRSDKEREKEARYGRRCWHRLDGSGNGLCVERPNFLAAFFHYA
jgi:hypothetical protein